MFLSRFQHLCSIVLWIPVIINKVWIFLGEKPGNTERCCTYYTTHLKHCHATKFCRLLKKVDTSSACCNMLLQLATTKFGCVTMFEVGVNTCNNAFQLVACITSPLESWFFSLTQDQYRLYYRPRIDYTIRIGSTPTFLYFDL